MSEYITYFRQVGKDQAQEAADLLKKAERLLQSATANLIVAQQEEGEHFNPVALREEQEQAESARGLAVEAWVLASQVAR